MSHEVLCKKCDVFVGYAAMGVVKMPTDEPVHMLGRICWVCRRDVDEIVADQEREPR